MANIEKYNDSDMTPIFQSSEKYEKSIIFIFCTRSKSDESKALIEYFVARHQKFLSDS